MADFSTNRAIVFQRSLGYLAMILIVLVIGVPIFWMLSGSLKTTQEIYSTNIQWVPASPRWGNYADAWNAAPFERFYFNSILITALGSSLEIINATLTAYALAFLRFPGKNLTVSYTHLRAHETVL